MCWWSRYAVADDLTLKRDGLDRGGPLVIADTEADSTLEKFRAVLILCVRS